MKLAIVLPVLFLVAVTGYAHNNVVVIPMDGDAPAAPPYSVGDTGPAGGIVFDITNNGLSGLEAARVDLIGFEWGCLGIDVAGVDNIPAPGTQEDIKSGAFNTILIVTECNGPAATAAASYIWPNGQRDGFLPNKEEVSLMYTNLHLQGLGGFADDYYWSSSENDSDNAWDVGFLAGDQDWRLKQVVGGVGRLRPVRAF